MRVLIALFLIICLGATVDTTAERFVDTVVITTTIEDELFSATIIETVDVRSNRARTFGIDFIQSENALFFLADLQWGNIGHSINSVFEIPIRVVPLLEGEEF